ncbi:23S rRNA (cytidine(2498)-2'-O)-methyltransferase RlmM [Halopseudomonas sp.]|uniref:23S rRNA (cytidine(2498)-2'-O)-methyltransferase RlmM n=1 Tax=Halopseudomonas sp. TaxID=2901191 RepID=UPI00300297DC|tara:strand:+ start:1153 stop:2238 length:1086 start_codon:yes stop_codon:yes gene_type:complete
MRELLLHCRPGFEGEAAAEIQELSAAKGIAGYVITKDGSALVRFVCPQEGDAEQLMTKLKFRQLIFARQWALGDWLDVPVDDRISPIITACSKGPIASCVWLETADTNDGKAMAALTKKLSRPLETALTKTRFVRPAKTEAPRLHLCFESGQRVFVGWSWANNAAPWPMGIPRLKVPRDAPSRSTLKLEEAWHHFVPRDEWDSRMAPGMTAVDLGAAPGGWTWQLVNRHMKVIAVDNGPMAPSLMDSGQVEHIQADGYLYKPKKTVHWMVCDIVDKPARSSALLGRWVGRGWCREAIINFKLPMKQRYQEVMQCIEHVQADLDAAGIKASIACKQLYSDREEVTCHVRVLHAGSFKIQTLS